MLGGPQFIGFPVELPQSDICGRGRKCHSLLALRERSFGPSTPAILHEPVDNEQCLRDEGSRNEHDLPTVLLPRSGWTKSDFAPCRQSAFADAEPLQLPPIEDRPKEVSIRDGNARYLGALDDAPSQPGSLLAKPAWSKNKTAGTADVDKCLCVDDDRA